MIFSGLKATIPHDCKPSWLEQTPASPWQVNAFFEGKLNHASGLLNHTVRKLELWTQSRKKKHTCKIQSAVFYGVGSFWGHCKYLLSRFLTNVIFLRLNMSRRCCPGARADVEPSNVTLASFKQSRSNFVHEFARRQTYLSLLKVWVLLVHGAVNVATFVTCFRSSCGTVSDGLAGLNYHGWPLFVNQLRC